jgi:hypothetical protein
MLVNSNTKVFEKPTSGMFLGVLADIVDLGLVRNKKYGNTQPMVRLVWVLNSKDSEGNNFRVMKQVTASMSEKANLFGVVRDIIGKKPEVPFELENLINTNSQLVISSEEAPDGKVYANIKAILLPQPGTPHFAVPAGFVRNKDKKNQPATSAQPTFATTAVTAVTSTAPAAGGVQVEDEDIPF